MVVEKRSKSRLKPRRELFFVIILLFFAKSGLSQIEQLKLTISPTENRISLCQSLPLITCLINLSCDTLQIVEPRVNKGSISLELIHNGVRQSAIKYGLSSLPDVIKMAPHDSILCSFNLEQVFPVIIESGGYYLQATYFPDEKISNAIHSNIAKIEVNRLSDADSASIKDYLSFLHCSIEGKHIRGVNFLDNHLNSCFTKNVRKEVGIALRIQKKYKEAIPYFKDALMDKKNLVDWEKDELLWELALTYYKLGEIDYAIQTMLSMKKGENNWKYVDEWKRELDASK